MSTVKQLLVDQMELVISSYSPFISVLTKKEKKDLSEISKCLKLLKKDIGE